MNSINRMCRVLPVAVAAAAIAVAGCEDKRNQPTTRNGADTGTGTTGTGAGTQRTGMDRTTPAPPPPATPPASPDRTGRNAPDNDTAPTPLDQGESETDRRISAEIRRAVMNIEGLSVSAQNCKIITRAGVVTLRGTVDTREERDLIEQRARAAQGVVNVVNELEVSGR